jgi:putative phage-type endonuclease
VKIFEFEQGTDEWLEVRRGVITGSNFSKVFTSAGKASSSCSSLVNQLISENLTKKPTETFKSDAMQRGNDLEPVARAKFELITGLDVRQIGFAKHDEYNLGCSPDGVIGEQCGLEIKCPMAATHCAYLRAGKLPSAYVQQVQGCMYILDLESYYFMSYHPDMPELIIEVKRDNELLELALPLLIKASALVTSETKRLEQYK